MRRRGPATRCRPGTTLPELLIVAWLFALVLLAVATFAGAQGRLAAASYDRTRATDAVRTIDLVLNRELRYTADVDLTAGGDSVRLRAVRGGGAICAVGPDVEIRYTGVRQPDPRKDSALVITGAGTIGSVHAVTGAGAVGAAGGCGDQRLRLEPMPRKGAGVVLVFETGTYHLSGGALRYRRGRGGRQPVTEEVLDTGWFDPRVGVLEARMTLRADAFPRLPALPVDATSVVRRLNAGAPP